MYTFKKMSSVSKIANLSLQRVDADGNLSDEKILCKDLWKDQACVIVFFRRFGCRFSRLAAKDLSENVKPVLDANNAKLIGIGFDTRKQQIDFLIYCFK